MGHGIRFVVAGLVGLLVAGSAGQARPIHRQALADYFGPFLAKKLNDCRTCHLPDQPGAAEKGLLKDKPHNPFGARLAAVKEELKKAGKKPTIAARLEAIANEDSDGDGVSNLIELLSGHFPGDPSDKPTAVETAETAKTLNAFRQAKAAYPWTPFETVHRPPVPQVKNGPWVRNPIDAFIAAEHEHHVLQPRPEAMRQVLLRRVYLDLIGLPPTPEELHNFLADQSADAYEKVVDDLLARPQYGERWGRHWMDVWRYADWAGWGQEVRHSQPHVWRWRDWIVESLNQDKGYDRMVVEMLAGDELAPEDANIVRATGYLVRNYNRYYRERWMQDAVDHTAQAFLGVTLGCARCHDHMYDPIRQQEYYQVRAIFEPYNVRLERLPGQPDPTKYGLARAFDANLDIKTFLYQRGDERTPEKTPLEPGVPEALGGSLPPVEAVRLPRTVSCPDKRAFVIRETIAAGEVATSKAQEESRKARPVAFSALSQALTNDPLRAAGAMKASKRALENLAVAEGVASASEATQQALVATIRAEQLEDAGKKDSAEWTQAATAAATLQRQAGVLEARRHLLGVQQALGQPAGAARTEAAKKVTEAEKTLAKAEADAKQPPTTTYAHRPVATYPASSSGRRLAFARWITDRQNPLAARVAMNHVWLRHFGQAIVPSVFDFGRNGRPPSHPALLDWLAAEFMDRGWSMKAMHRLIVTSSTYRMASTPDPANVVKDRDNQFLWRMPSRRMEAEVVRDCLFYVAGKLDLSMGGPDIDHQQGLTAPRRSIYFRHAQEKQMEFLKIFDCAAVSECYQRKESVLPQQSLALANSELALQHARLLARNLAARTGSDAAAFIRAAFEQVLARPPSAAELSECLAFLDQQAKNHGGNQSKPAGNDPVGALPSSEPTLRARENLVHVLLNHHDFVTIR